MKEMAVIILGLLGILLWLAIMVRWRPGFLGLLLFMPFAGMVALLLQPNKWPLILKDVAFVLPTYLSLFAFHQRDLRNVSVPRPVIWSLVALTFLVLIQMLNPQVSHWMVAVIGLKIWLFYVPIMFVAAAYVNTREDLARLFRILAILAIIPCAVGIIQWFGALTFGFQNVMTSFYGDAARGATGNFGTHEYGGTLFRIPSTFTFVSQYFGFTFGMIVIGYCMLRLQTTQAGKKLALALIGLYIAASVLSGARGAFIFIPLLLVLIALLDRRLSGIFGALVILPVTIITVLDLGGLDPFKALGEAQRLTGYYSDEIVYKKIVEAIVQFPLGAGTGMNTGAARHAVENLSQLDVVGAKQHYLENYYAKAIVELGMLGLVAVVAVFVSLIAGGFAVLRSLKDRGLQGCAAAILGFIITMAIHSGKGWQIDFDPINVFFWMLAGILFKLPVLEGATSPKPGSATAARLAYPGTMHRPGVRP